MIRIPVNSTGCAVGAGICLLPSASNRAHNLFVSNYANGGPMYQYAPSSTFATGLAAPGGLAFSNEPLPVPEPSAWGLLSVAAGIVVCRQRPVHARLAKP